MRKFEYPPQTFKKSKVNLAAILWSLHLQGPVEDPRTGLATQVLLDRLSELGVDMPASTLNRFLTALGPIDATDPKTSEFPYEYIERETRGKRTYHIALCVDPTKVPFPPNPFKERNLAPPAAEPEPDLGDEDGDDEEETFARQALFDPQPPEPEEPDPELLAPLETAAVPGPYEAAVAPYVPEEPRSNGNNYELLDLPDDLLAPLPSDAPQNAMGLVSDAISLLTTAMAAYAEEQQHGIVDRLENLIDGRLGQFRLLQVQQSQTEAKLRHVLANYQKVVDIARAQRREIERLRRLVADKASVK